jgi:hypothetical protein
VGRQGDQRTQQPRLAPTPAADHTHTPPPLQFVMFDFLPEEPTSPATAAALLSGRAVPGALPFAAARGTRRTGGHGGVAPQRPRGAVVAPPAGALAMPACPSSAAAPLTPVWPPRRPAALHQVQQAAAAAAAAAQLGAGPSQGRPRGEGGGVQQVGPLAPPCGSAASRCSAGCARALPPRRAARLPHLLCPLLLLQTVGPPAGAAHEGLQPLHGGAGGRAGGGGG